MHHGGGGGGGVIHSTHPDVFYDGGHIQNVLTYHTVQLSSTTVDAV